MYAVVESQAEVDYQLCDDKVTVTLMCCTGLCGRDKDKLMLVTRLLQQ